MPKVTGIYHKKEKKRYWIYIDGEYVHSIDEKLFSTLDIKKGTEISVTDLKSRTDIITDIIFIDNQNPMEDRHQIVINGLNCTKIRARTMPAMKIKVGTKISCSELKDFETYVWKRLYGPASWEKEKVRINKVKSLIEEISDNLEITIVGFGADSVEELSFHPTEAGSPDLSIINKGNSSGTEVMVEVTGTERMKDSELNEYWVRPDKLEYIKQHPDKCIWIVLHYAEPKEKFVFIKPNIDGDYDGEFEIIRGANEKYVKFTDQSKEVKSFHDFSEDLQNTLL